MAKTNYEYEYHPADLRYLTQKLPVITSVAQTLNVSPLDVAAGIIREMNNERFVYPKDTVRWLGQPLKRVARIERSEIRETFERPLPDGACSFRKGDIHWPVCSRDCGGPS